MIPTTYNNKVIRPGVILIISTWTLVFFCISSCVKPQGETQFELAQAHEDTKEYLAALKIYEKIFQTSSNKDLVLLSAFRAQEISYLQLKDYKKTRKYLLYFIANAKSFGESQEALKRLANIEHKTLNLYEAAIGTYYRILGSAKLEKSEEKTFRLEMARCYYAINKFEEALQELQRINLIEEPDDEKVTVMMLMANIFQSQGKTTLSLELIDKILELQISENNRKDVVLNKVIVLEHEEKYKEALQALEKLSSSSEVIESKKNQLKRLATFQRSRRQ